MLINEDYHARVEQEHSPPSSIDEDYYARVEQEHSIDRRGLYYARVEQKHSPPSSIDEDYYARVEQEHSPLSSIDGSVIEGNVFAANIKYT